MNIASNPLLDLFELLWKRTRMVWPAETTGFGRELPQYRAITVRFLSSFKTCSKAKELLLFMAELKYILCHGKLKVKKKGMLGLRLIFTYHRLLSTLSAARSGPQQNT